MAVPSLMVDTHIRKLWGHTKINIAGPIKNAIGELFLSTILGIEATNIGKFLVGDPDVLQSVLIGIQRIENTNNDAIRQFWMGVNNLRFTHNTNHLKFLLNEGGINAVLVFLEELRTQGYNSEVLQAIHVNIHNYLA